jgi:hypothetical protein
VLIYFFRGELPWQGLRAANRKQKYEAIADKKRTTPVDKLCRDMPQGITSLLLLRTVIADSAGKRCRTT